MRACRPDVLLGMGSYACVGPVLAAKSRGVPVILHEANAAPGRATRLLARCADVVALNFASAVKWFPNKRAVITGMPLRGAFATLPDIERPCSPLTVLVMGGSLGAAAVNEAACQALCAWQGGRNPVVLHLCGEGRSGAMCERYAEAGVAAEVHDFFVDMPALYARASVAVCRAGASTCAELAVCGVPSVFIPLPGAPGDHQTRNAEALASVGAAVVVPQTALNAHVLQHAIMSLVSDPASYSQRQQAARQVGVRDGASRLADVAETIAAGCGR